MTFPSSIRSEVYLLIVTFAVLAAISTGASCTNNDTNDSGSQPGDDVELCTNGADDDDDDAIDCDDADCATHPECTGALNCDAVTPGDGGKNELCSVDDDCDSDRCCRESPADCNNPANLCTCRDPR
jgi:hypothetical protein